MLFRSNNKLFMDNFTAKIKQLDDNFTAQIKQLDVDLVEKFRFSNRVRSLGRYILRQIFPFMQR